jgi:acyl-CoA synthetase (AMP-forming)/AMP-acid ligase II
MNDISWLFDLFNKNKDKISIIYDNKKYTYLELINNIDYYMIFLKKQNIFSGQIIAINSDYSFQSISLFFALVKNKNVIVPIISNVENEVISKLKAVKADFLITFKNDKAWCKNQNTGVEKHKLIQKLQKLGNSGLILFSSGSTGEPKAMLHDFDNLHSIYKDKKQKYINTLIFLTFDHIGGIDTMLRIFSITGTITIPNTRQPEEICKIIEQYNVNVLPSSPTFLNLLLIGKFHNKYDLHSLEIISFGAEPMPDSLLKRLNKEFPHVALQQKFGTSETNAIRVKSKANNSLFMKFDDPNLDYKIVDNELWLKSKTQVMGYLNSSMDSFTDDGWFKTGDLVEKTDDGYIKIIGRNKEVINVGGEKVLPNEVESVILSMDMVDDVMVYGESNIITGQTVVCDAVINLDIERKEAKKLIRKFCKNSLDGYKIPTKVSLVDKTNFGDRFKKIRRK